MVNNMNSYIVRRGAGEKFTVSVQRPEGAKAPDTEGSLVYIAGEGLWVTMRCFEENPRAIYYNPNGWVYTDSCMEIFIDCFPELHKGYINLEMNANGAAFCSFGTDRYARGFLIDMGIPHPEVTVTKGEENGRAYWQVRSLLRESTLEKLYGVSAKLESGHKMRANFYKCGDHTATPHWASWAPVGELDFHAPQYFGTLIVE